MKASSEAFVNFSQCKLLHALDVAKSWLLYVTEHTNGCTANVKWRMPLFGSKRHFQHSRSEQRAVHLALEGCVPHILLDGMLITGKGSNGVLDLGLMTIIPTQDNHSLVRPSDPMLVSLQTELSSVLRWPDGQGCVTNGNIGVCL